MSAVGLPGTSHPEGPGWVAASGTWLSPLTVTASPVTLTPIRGGLGRAQERDFIDPFAGELP